MAKKEHFVLTYDQEAARHLSGIEAKYHSLIRDTIEEQLSFEPQNATRNRKQLKETTSFGANWELRLGPGNRLRVFYWVDEEARQVQVLAIGVKERNRLFIAGKETVL